MNKYGFYISLIALFSSVAGAKAQQTPQALPVLAFDEWRQHDLQEELYVRTDRNLYMAGEIAWFRIVDVDGALHKPLALSAVAYVELMDPSGKPVWQSRVSLKDHDGSGSIPIPAELRTGYYTLRGYTQWMKNFDTHFFFEKRLTIIQPEQRDPDSASGPGEVLAIQFSPEGGNLIDGIESKVALQVSDPFGKGIACSGIILDGDKDTITRFQTFATGIGHFSLTPGAGHSYRARVLVNGKVVEQQLPASLGSGFSMQVDPDSSGRIGIHIHARGILADSVFVFAHTRGEIKMAAFVPLKDGQGSIWMDKRELDPGITHFTVFRNDQPVCERLYFTSPENQFRIEATTDAGEYGKREKIKIHIRTADNLCLPAAASLSVSVFKLRPSEVPEDMNIRNWLLLQADLTGPIQSLALYFEKPVSEAAMDDLMLMHKWGRFDWKEILQRQKPAWKYAPEINGEIVSARITDKATGRPVEDMPILLSVRGKQTRFWSSVSDSDGIVHFDVKNAYGDEDLIFQTPDNHASVDYISPFSERRPDHPMPPFNLTRADPSPLDRENIYLQVQHIYHTDELNHFEALQEDNTPFYQRPDVVYLVERYTRFATLEETFREFVREVNVSNSKGSFHLHVNDARNRLPFDPDPLILLDGVAMTNIDSFMKVDPRMIKSIEVVTKKYFIGGTGYYGIIDCKTYKGDMNGYTSNPGSLVIHSDGLQVPRRFFAPIYGTPQQKASRSPDFRNVLYWNPALNTGGSGTADASGTDIEFYSSDLAGSYVAVIEGLSTRGYPAVTHVYFNIKK